MTEWYDGIVTGIKNALEAVFVKKNSTSGLLKNDGTVDTNTYLTSSSLSNYVQKSQTNGLIKNNGTIDTNTYLNANQSAANNGKFLKVNSSGDIICESVSFNGTDLSVTQISGIADLNDYKTTGFYYIAFNNANSITNTPPYNEEDISLMIEGKSTSYVRQTASVGDSTYIRSYDYVGEQWSNWVNIRRPNSHTGLEYGAGTASNYGHVKLSDSYASSDGAASASVGASSKAVSDSYGTLSTIKENKYGFWYGNSSSNAPTWALHDKNDPLEIKQNTPIKIFVYTNTSNGHENVCNLGESVQNLFAKIVINDVIYSQYMDTTTKTINMPISWNPGVSGNMTIHVFWGEWSLGSDIIRFTIVDNYS